MRATSFQFRTAFSAELLPPLRQTASCTLTSLPNSYRKYYVTFSKWTDVFTISTCLYSLASLRLCVNAFGAVSHIVCTARKIYFFWNKHFFVIKLLEKILFTPPKPKLYASNSGQSYENFVYFTKLTQKKPKYFIFRWNYVISTFRFSFARQTSPLSCSPTLSGSTNFSHSRALSTALSLVCSQRPSGLAQRRLPLPFMRATNIHLRTAFSAGLMPPLRQTAS